MGKKGLLLIAFLAVMGGVSAQPDDQQPYGPPPGVDGGPAQPVSSSRMAEMRTEMMAGELGLTEKQRKKVYKINLKQIESARSAQSSQGGISGEGAGRPPGGGMGGGRMSGGGAPGGMGGGMSGGMSGGGAPGGMGGGHRMGGTPPARQHHAGEIYEESEKDTARREKKMKKILTPQQYAGWQRMESERRRHEMREQLNRSIAVDGNAPML